MIETKYYLIVNTNSYAGNFERDLCAHLTGFTGECGVGENFIDDEIHEMFESYRGDYFFDGCLRPVEMFRDECDKGAYNSIRISLESPLPPKLIEIIKERCNTFNAVRAEKENWREPTPIEIRGVKLMTEVIKTVQETEQL